ncbi:TonB family protein [Mucilaginibacter sp. RS28]|uniref:TonB family protein n=1 Tax=Mucilaginibacter straminoryzae TaxID=2932774 RepID=A0A9X1X1C2_9SPHI|nr:energy transducer TonB [Mucilaginibacter straminoryzae]MCJ8208195.1 TonB family protein [Mucilaginibacter straminoryzae]
MRSAYLTLLFLLFTLVTFAQKPKRRNIYFYKNDNTRVESADSADYIQIVSEPDSGSQLYNVEEFYKNDTRRLIGKSTRINPVRLDGTVAMFYPNGNKKMYAEYTDGFLSGKVYQYYPNGKRYIIKEYVVDQKELAIKAYLANRDSIITSVFDSTGKPLAENGNGQYVRYLNNFKDIGEQATIKDGHFDGKLSGFDERGKITFEETYDHGKLISGFSTDSAGVKYLYQQRYVSGQYPGGLSALGRYLGMNIRYPDEARRANIQGTVAIRFTIRRDGTVDDLKVLNPVSPELDQEALRVVEKMPKWNKGYAYGRPVPFSYVVPVSFRLQ